MEDNTIENLRLISYNNKLYKTFPMTYFIELLFTEILSWYIAICARIKKVKEVLIYTTLKYKMKEMWNITVMG